MKKSLQCVFFVFTVLCCHAQCGSPIHILQSANRCVGSDTLILTGASGLSEIAWYKDSAITYTAALATQGYGVEAAGFGIIDSDNVIRPSSVMMDGAGNIYVASIDRVIKFNAGSAPGDMGTIVAGGNRVGNALNQLSLSSSDSKIFVTYAGDVYVADGYNNRVIMFPAGSNSSTYGTIVAGGNGVGIAANQLNEPVAVFLDNIGNLYVADKRNFRVQKFPAGSNSSTNGLTIAGSDVGLSGYSLNQLNGVEDLYVDAAGNVFVADYLSERIVKFPTGSTANSNGIVVAGTGHSGTGTQYLNVPLHLWLDGAGNIYVADGYCVKKFPANSVANTPSVIIAGGNSTGSALNKFGISGGLYVDNGGYVYVGDPSNGRVLKFPPNSDTTTNGVVVAGNTYTFNRPSGVFIDTAGNLFVNQGSSILKFPPYSNWQTPGIVVAGTDSTGFAASRFKDDGHIFVDAAGNIYVADIFGSRIQKFPAGSSRGSNAITVAGVTGSYTTAANNLWQPVAVFVDVAGYIYVSEQGNNRVQKFPPNSTSGTNAVTVAGGNGVGSAANQLNEPQGIFVTANGDLYVADRVNGRIQKFPAGSTSATNGITVAGGKGSGLAANQLSSPTDIYLDAAGNIFVTAGFVKKFPPNSTSGTNGVIVAGCINFYNQPATTARDLSFGCSMAFDRQNNVYIADVNNKRVMKWNLNDSLFSIQDTIYIPKSAGSYTVVGLGISGCIDTSNTVNVLFTPTATITTSSGRDYFCPGNHITLNTATGLGYQWSTGSTDSSIIVNTANTYRVTVTAADGCVDTDTIDISQRQVVTPIISIVINKDTICVTDSSLLTPVLQGGTSPYSYAWNNGVNNYSFYTTLPGSYTVTVTDANICSATASIDIYSCNNDVWPGDANSDLVADNNDLLNIGLAYGQTGAARPNATNLWQAQPCQNWASYFGNAANYKHADCDGNGIIDANDTIPIVQNFGLTHTRSITDNRQSGAPVIYIANSADSIAAGDIVTLNVILGEANNLVANFYGIAFSLNIDFTKFDTSYFESSFPASWIGSTSNKIEFVKPVFTQNLIKSSVVRINHTSVSGTGNIGYVKLKASASLTQNSLLYPALTDVNAIDNLGNAVPLNAVTDTLLLKALPTGMAETDAENAHVYIYPNPTLNELYIHTENSAQVVEVKIYNTQGQLVKQINKPLDNNADVSSLAQGVYVADVKLNGAMCKIRWLKM